MLAIMLEPGPRSDGSAFPPADVKVTAMMRLRAGVLAHLLVLGCLLHSSPGADSPPVPSDVPPALAPAEAKKTFQVARGLEFELVASEPMVQQPLCITFDDRGRLWVLQYLQYPIPNGLKAVEVDQYLRTKYDRVPEPPPEGPRGADRIIILEDPDGDGVYRKAKDFVSGLNLASGMALGYGGVFVVAAALPALLRRQEPRRRARRRPRGAAQGLRHGGRPRLRQLAHLGARRLALRGAGEHGDGQHPRHRVPAGHLALSPEDPAVRAVRRGGRQHLGHRLRPPRPALRRRQHHRAALPPRAGRLLHQGLRQARPAAQPLHLRLLQPRPAPRLPRQRPDRRLRHLPGRTLPRAVQGRRHLLEPPRQCHARQPARAGRLDVHHARTRKTSSSRATAGSGRSRAWSGPTARSTSPTGTTTTSATRTRRTAASGTCPAATPAGSGAWCRKERSPARTASGR